MIYFTTFSVYQNIQLKNIGRIVNGNSNSEGTYCVIVSCCTSIQMLGPAITRFVRKIKNVCAYNPRSCFIVTDQSCGVFGRV